MIDMASEDQIPPPSDKWLAALYSVGITKEQITRLVWLRWLVDTNQLRGGELFKDRLSE